MVKKLRFLGMARIPRNVVGALWWVRCSGRDLAGKKICALAYWLDEKVNCAANECRLQLTHINNHKHWYIIYIKNKYV